MQCHGSACLGHVGVGISRPRWVGICPWPLRASIIVPNSKVLSGRQLFCRGGHIEGGGAGAGESSGSQDLWSLARRASFEVDFARLLFPCKV